ncbi:MAG: very short patch repair endonuclease [Chloroflexi bacterium]|nr:very short patch repair endonuclease [Chloroflexota bacterium]
MQQNVGRETSPETSLRSVLHRRGLRFRKEMRPEPSLRISADIVFPRQHVCVFIDGCFWHGCPYHFKAPKTHTDWWLEKIEDNRRRDFRQCQVLMKYGWIVVRVWEHDLSQNGLSTVSSEIATLVKGDSLHASTVRVFRSRFGAH